MMILLGKQKMKKSKQRQIKRAINTTIVTKQVSLTGKNFRSCHQWLQGTMGADELGAKNKKRPRRKKWHGMAWIGMVVFRMFFKIFKENTKTI